MKAINVAIVVAAPGSQMAWQAAVDMITEAVRKRGGEAASFAEAVLQSIVPAFSRERHHALFVRSFANVVRSLILRPETASKQVESMLASMKARIFAEGEVMV